MIHFGILLTWLLFSINFTLVESIIDINVVGGGLQRISIRDSGYFMGVNIQRDRWYWDGSYHLLESGVSTDVTIGGNSVWYYLTNTQQSVGGDRINDASGVHVSGGYLSTIEAMNGISDYELVGGSLEGHVFGHDGTWYLVNGDGINLDITGIPLAGKIAIYLRTDGTTLRYFEDGWGDVVVEFTPELTNIVNIHAIRPGDQTYLFALTSDEDFYVSRFDRVDLDGNGLLGPFEWKLLTFDLALASPIHDFDVSSSGDAIVITSGNTGDGNGNVFMGYLFSSNCPNGYASSNTLSCSERGVCVSNMATPGDGECLCDSDYSESDCHHYTCFTFDHDDASRRGCSGNGDCDAPDACLCDGGYGGVDCSNWNCSGIAHDDLENVCSGHGECVSPDLCVCTFRYIGYVCQNLSDAFEHLKGDIYNPIDESQAEFSCMTDSAQITSRANFCGFTFRNHMTYVFGGEVVENSELYNDVWSFDTSNNQWCFISGNTSASGLGVNIDSEYGEVGEYLDTNFPSPRSSFGSLSTAFSFLVFGGRTTREGNSTTTNEVWEFSVVEKKSLGRHKWRVLHEHNSYDDEIIFRPKADLCVGHYGNELDGHAFVFGGTEDIESNHLYTNDLWMYSLLNSTFEQLRNSTSVDTFPSSEIYSVSDHYSKGINTVDENLSPPRRTSMACWMESNINFYVFGGLFPNRFSSNDMWFYNTTSSMWSFIFGGSNNTENEIVIADSYGPSNLPSVRNGMAVFSNSLSYFFGEDVEFYFFGGGDRRLGMFWGDIWAFSPGLNMFRIVNRTEDGYNRRNTEVMIGGRMGATGICTPTQGLLILGGLTLL